MTDAAVEALDLRKTYGNHVAVEGLTLRVGPGEVVGLLGPNGAGKTTTVKMLLGLVHPTSGQALLFGEPAGDPAARRRVGYLPEHFQFPDWLTGRELLDVHARLAGVSAADRRRQIPQLLDRVGLAGRGDDRLRAYSKGMGQRIGLAQALVGRPDLVLLDEPTSALDPIGRREVRELIRQLRTDGVAVLLNSHLLSEVEQVCERVAIVDKGRVLQAGLLTELAGGTELRITLDRVDDRAIALLAGYGDVVASDAVTVVLALDAGDSAAEVAALLVGEGYRLEALVPVRRSLEDLFMGLVGRQAPAGAGSS